MRTYNLIETPEVPVAAVAPAGTSVVSGIVMLAKRIIVMQTSVLRCQAQHPRGSRVPRLRGARHNKFIVELPFLVRFTGRIVRRREDVYEGMIPGQCPECGLISEYEIVSEVQ